MCAYMRGSLWLRLSQQHTLPRCRSLQLAVSASCCLFATPLPLTQKVVQGVNDGDLYLTLL